MKHSSALDLRIKVGKELDRTKQRLPSSTKKRQCKVTLIVGAILAAVREWRETMTAQ